MKYPSLLLSLGTVLSSLALIPATAAAAPKKLLVVSVTTGFRHSSIPTMNRVIGQLGMQSHAFTVDYIEQPPGKPSDADLATNSEAKAKWDLALKSALARLAPESLKNYDGVIFANTTGDLPIPDRAGFSAWIKSGKAFIGLHAASDTFHGWPDYAELVGGEFVAHGPQLSVSCINEDPQHPANKALGKTFDISLEEIYQIKKHDRSKEHELLSLDKKPVAADPQPGFYPVSWCHNYGKGRVFYSTLGHREDIIDADPNLKDRKNPVEVSKAYQAHVLGGILWALGLAPGDATPQAK